MKKNIARKPISVLLSILMVLSLFGGMVFTAQADDVTCPICGGTNVEDWDGGQWFCYDCREDFWPGQKYVCPDCGGSKINDVIVDEEGVLEGFCMDCGMFVNPFKASDDESTPHTDDGATFEPSSEATGLSVDGDNLCKWCEKDHSGSFWQKIVGCFHSILYFFAHLFGKI